MLHCFFDYNASNQTADLYIPNFEVTGSGFFATRFRFQPGSPGMDWLYRATGKKTIRSQQRTDQDPGARQAGTVRSYRLQETLVAAAIVTILSYHDTDA